MTQIIKFVKSLFSMKYQMSDTHGVYTNKKSSVIQPLIYALGVVSLLLLGMIRFRDGAILYDIILILISLVFLILVFSIIYSYFSCLNKDPDLLRSEAFVLDKMKIERQLIGDTENKLIEVGTKTETNLIIKGNDK